MRETLELARGTFGTAAIVCLPSKPCPERRDHVLEARAFLWLRHDAEETQVQSFRLSNSVLRGEGPVPERGEALRTCAQRWIEDRILVRSGSPCEPRFGHRYEQGHEDVVQLTQELYFLGVESPALWRRLRSSTDVEMLAPFADEVDQLLELTDSRSLGA